MKDLSVYIYRMIDSIDQIDEYTQNMEFSDFDTDMKTVLSVAMLFQIIWEQAKRIKNLYPDAAQDLPIKEMIGLRDWISHDYFGMELEVLWETIHEDLPAVKIQLKTLIS